MSGQLAPRVADRGPWSGGFTLIELLVVMGITLAVSGAIVAIAPQALAAFERVPADLEIQQRGRAALDTLAQSVRAAGRNVPAVHALGEAAVSFPSITLSDPDASGSNYRSMSAVVPVVDAAQGVLETSQISGGSPITLAVTGCPNVKDVCGFATGSTAAIVDPAGHVDVFVVASTNAGARRLTPDRGLSLAYAAGSIVVEIEHYTYYLDEQSDGSYSLVRVTAAGAVQPVADYLSALSFTRVDQQLDIAFSVQPLAETTALAAAERRFTGTVLLRGTRLGSVP